MLPSRHASIHPAAGPVRAGPAPAETASTPFARLERQLHRGGPRLGPERALADRVFSVVARTICSTADALLDDTTQDDALIGAPWPPGEPGAAPDPLAVPIASPPGTRSPAAPDAAEGRHPRRVAATSAPRSVKPMTPVPPVVRPLGRVSAVAPATRPLHQQTSSRHSGLGRAVVLGVVLAVMVVALTLNLLGVPAPAAHAPGGAPPGPHEDRNADAADDARRPPR
jgi:hypothetical protein